MHQLHPSRDLADPLDAYLEVDRSRPRGECWVMGHMVAGLDGTAAVHGRVGPLSTAPDQNLFRRMRQLADVVLVGAQTVRREGYERIRLDAEALHWRLRRGMPPTPPLAVVTRSLRLDWDGPLFAPVPEQGRTLVVTCAEADPQRLRQAERRAEVVIAGQDRVEPRLAVAALAGLGHRVAICEGGPSWLGEVAAAGRLDELCLTISPLMGGDRLPVAVTPPGAGVTGFSLRHVLVEDDTLFLRYQAA